MADACQDDQHEAGGDEDEQQIDLAHDGLLGECDLDSHDAAPRRRTSVLDAEPRRNDPEQVGGALDAASARAAAADVELRARHADAAERDAERPPVRQASRRVARDARRDDEPPIPKLSYASGVTDS